MASGLENFKQPLNPQDAFNAAQMFGGKPDQSQKADGFSSQPSPSVSGTGTRQSRVPNWRQSIYARNIMHWLIPEGPIVQMYINPQTASYKDKKDIQHQRTKGGFVVQYWGESLGTVTLNGTTGSSGIEGINVLYDIYRNEQLAFDPFALFMKKKNDEQFMSGGGIGSAIGGAIGGGSGSLGADIGGAIGGFLTGDSPSILPDPPPGPSLAQLACTVELYWSGAVFRGFFTDFNVSESADRIGLFNYDLTFMVTQRRGFRQNSFAWQHSATSGPSNSDPDFGTPRSYGSPTIGEQVMPGRDPSPPSGPEAIGKSIARSIGFDL